MKRLIVLVAGVLAGAGGVWGQPTPFWLNETHRMGLGNYGGESNTIVSSWLVDNEPRYLIQTSSLAIVTDGYRILWRSPYGCDFATAIDFRLDDGIGVIINAQNTLRYYYGDNLSQELATEYQVTPYRPDEDWRLDGYRLSLIAVAKPGIPDTLRRIIVGFARTSTRPRGDDEEFYADGVYKLLSFGSDIEVTTEIPYYPKACYQYDLDGNPLDSTVILGQNGSGVLTDHGPTGSSNAGVIKLQMEQDEIHYSAINLNGLSSFWRSAIYAVPGDASYVAAIYGTSDYSIKLVWFRLPNFNIASFLHQDYIRPQRLSIVRDPQTLGNYMLLFSGTPYFQLIRLSNGAGAIDKNFLWEPEGETMVDFLGDDFDDNGQTEILVLTENYLITYRLRGLSVPEDSPFLPPPSFSFSSFPNPFNSSTTISYSLPKPGRYALDVMDINGRLVTRLSDGWREAGSYREAWRAPGQASGMYYLQISNGRFASAIPVTILK